MCVLVNTCVFDWRKSMALSEIEVVCDKCDQRFKAIPKRSFLGFQKIECSSCNEKITYPLTTGYRIIYLVLFFYMIFAFAQSLAAGGSPYLGGFGLAIMFALLKDVILIIKTKGND